MCQADAYTFALEAIQYSIRIGVGGTLFYSGRCYKGRLLVFVSAFYIMQQCRRGI